ncbi:MAG TPA: hypothetical protein VMV94_05415 [Phycisphaerae bacterium]|nr:hypothetical protein [Phycisphaerae bacterium]
MRLCVLVITLALCGLVAMPATGQEMQGGMPTTTPGAPAGIDVAVISPAEVAAMDRVQVAYPGTLFYREGSQLTRLYGRTFEMGETPNDSAQRFLSANADLFGAEAADLLPTTPILPSGNTLPLMYEPETGTYRFTLIYHTQYRDGIPVFRSGVRTLVKNEAGYPLVWAGSSLKRLGQFHPDTTLRSAVDPATVAPEMTSFTAVEPVIWAGVDDKLEAPVHAVTFEASNEGSGSSIPQKWLYVVDAATGEVLYKENQIITTDVTGSVHGMATTPSKSDVCNPEADSQMKYAKVSIGSTTAYADSSGNFTIPNGGTSQVTVTSYVAGQYFTVHNYSGSEETLTQTVTPPGPANFVHNQSNSDEYVRSQTNAYVQANVIRDWVLTYDPSYPAIPTQTNFPIYVNRTDGYCPGNAWFSGNSLNFCAASMSYPNTAYSSVVHHEYGHNMCQAAGTGQDQYGEGVGDSVAVCIADDPVIGYGFFGTCSSGLRTADNTMQYPCSGEAHSCAPLLSGCVWSTRNQLQAAFPSTYRDVLSSLMINSIPMHAGSSTISQSIYTDWITLDGGPTGQHATAITNGFAAHNMVVAPANDMCLNGTLVTSGTYTGSTATATVDGSASCGSSGSTKDVWFKYTTGIAGTLTVDTCSSGFNTVLSIHTGCPGTSSNQVASGCNDNSTQCGAGSQQSYLSVPVSGTTTYYIRVSGNNGANGPFTLHVSGPDPDVTPPTPNPMTFNASPSGAPRAVGTSSISMTATQATDPFGGIQYYFTGSGVGVHSSGWQTSQTFTDTGLQVNRSYSYKVKARDTFLNETADSASGVVATFIETPTALTFGTVTATSIQVTAPGTFTRLSQNLSGLYFEVTALDGTLVGGGGVNTWTSLSSSQTVTAAGLSAGTTYRFRVKARNYYGLDETPWYPASGYLQQATIAVANCQLLGDMNQDGVVNGLDIGGFVRVKLGGTPLAGENGACANFGGTLQQDITAFVTELLAQ